MFDYKCNIICLRVCTEHISHLGFELCIWGKFPFDL